MQSDAIKIYLKLFLLLSVFAIPVFFSSATTTFAATPDNNGFSFGVFPPIIKIKAVSDSSIQTTVTVYNFSTETTEVSVTTQPFTPEKNLNGQVTLLPYTPGSWKDSNFLNNVHLLIKDKEVDSVKLGPKQQQPVTLKIDIPKNETESDYYFSILFISKDSSIPAYVLDKSNNSLITNGVGTNVLVSIGTDKKAVGSIENFSTSIIWDHGPVSFLVQVKNSGLHSFAPEGQILIKNLFGQTVGNLTLLPVNILSESSRIIPTALSKNESSSLNQSAAQAFWNEKFLLGPYTAILKIKLSDSGPLFERTILFLGFPTQIFLGLAVAIFLVLFIIGRVKNKI